MRLLLASAIPLLMVAPLSHAQSSRWSTLGSARIVPGRSPATIFVSGPQRAREVRLCIDHGSLWVSELWIEYLRGTHQRVRVSRTLSHGICSFATRLRRDQAIRSVRFSFGRQGGGTRPWARVQAR